MTDTKKAPRQNGTKQTNTGCEDNPRTTQKATILKYFQDHVSTVRMCEQATGVSAQAICGYKAQLLEDQKLIELDKKHCQVTGKKAFYYTADPKSLIS